MMPGVGFLETILLVLAAIVVIGPKDLPLMMRKFGRFTGKMRALAFEFKQGIDELGRQAELEELRKEVADLKKHTGLEDLQKDFEQDQINLQKDVDSAMAPAALPPATPGPATPALTNGAATEANGAAAEPAPAPLHAGLSPDHPGYDTGEDYTADPAAPAEPVPAPAAPQPVKQDTPA